MLKQSLVSCQREDKVHYSAHLIDSWGVSPVGGRGFRQGFLKMVQCAIEEVALTVLFLVYVCILEKVDPYFFLQTQLP